MNTKLISKYGSFGKLYLLLVIIIGAVLAQIYDLKIVLYIFLIAFVFFVYTWVIRFSKKMSSRFQDRIFSTRNNNLIWSEIMGPSTWDEVEEIIKQKGKGWRLPTVSELKDSGYESVAYQNFWSAHDRTLVDSAELFEMGHPAGGMKRPVDHLAKFILVMKFESITTL